MHTAKELQVQELIVGASNKYSADEQLEAIAFYWMTLHGGKPPPLTVRVIGKDRDVRLDLAGGFRIPKMGERRARSVEELRAAGIGVDRVLLVPGEGRASIDLFQAVLTMLDARVMLGLVEERGSDGEVALEQSRQLGRDLKLLSLHGERGPEIVRPAREGECDAIILALPPELPDAPALPLEPWVRYVLAHALCRVFLTATPRPPQEVVE